MASDNTGLKQAPTQFQAGRSGNPAGRPRGSRNRLGEQFLDDVLRDWEAHGAGVICKVREDRPDVYLKVVASILPKDLTIKKGGGSESVQDLSDDELMDIIRDLQEQAPDGETGS